MMELTSSTSNSLHLGLRGEVSASFDEDSSPNSSPTHKSGKAREYNLTYLIGIILTLALGSFQYGYSMVEINVLINNLVYVYGWNMTREETMFYFYTALGTCILPLGALIGSMLGGIFSKYGSRHIILINNLILVFGVGITLIEYFPCLVVGRAFHGISVGIYSILVPMYIREIIPLEIAGALETAHPIMINLGILFGFGLAFILPLPPDKGDKLVSETWRILLALPILVSFIQISLLRFFFIYETPKYLVQHQHYEECERALACIYDLGDRIKNELTLLENQQGELEENNIQWKDIFGLGYKRALLIGCSLGALHQLCGINFVMFYSVNIFNIHNTKYESNSIIASLIIGIVNLLFTVISLFLVDKMGRRVLLIIGSSFMMVILTILGVIMIPDASNIQWLPQEVLYSLFVAGFAFSVGPITWVYLSEILPEKGLCLATAVNWFVCVLIGFTGIFMISNKMMHENIFIYAGSAFITLIFSIFFIKETKEKSRVEIRTLFRPYWYSSVARDNKNMGILMNQNSPYSKDEYIVSSSLN